MSPDLPIQQALPALRQALASSPTVILQAPPGAGKSTVVPLELMAEPWLAGQKIVMLEPRRLAARSVAMRMAQTLGEKAGERVGYRVRFENKTSNATQVEVLTEGILTRLLQNDQSLEGVGMVIFDEFHERSLQADLALALCRQVQQLLRPELRILVMSATLDAEELSPILGRAPIVTSEGRQYPLSVTYLGHDTHTRLDQQMATAIRQAMRSHEGDVLAFLPGTAEIERLNALLEEAFQGQPVALHPLYGDLPFERQQQAIEPDRQGRRKVILATSIAETSLTIENVRIVVDSGFTRTPRFDPRSGLTRLETVRITLDSATQRAGRAARQGPGFCYRLWTEATHHQLEARRRPEILEADLAPLLLELAQWGEEPGSLSWVTPPPPGPLAQARDILTGLEALENGRITRRGKEMLALPTHPRLAHMLLEGRDDGLASLAADVAALLEERDPLQNDPGAGADLTLRVEALRRSRNGVRQGRGGKDSLRRVEKLASAWRSALRCPEDNHPPDPESVGRLVAMAYPDRVAGRMQAAGSAYRMSSGRNASLPAHDALEAHPFLAVAQLDGGQGRIFMAAPLGIESLRALSKERRNVGWDAREGQLVARRERTVGALIIESSPITNLSAQEKEPILVEAIRQEGLRLFEESDAAQQFRARVLSLRHWRPQEAWPDLSAEALAATAAEWAGPYLAPVRNRQDFKKIDLLNILKGLVPWDLLPRLDTLAPPTLGVPSGSDIRLEYFEDGRQPVLAVRLQELFGLGETPKVNEGRQPVLLHLLSPGYKPVQVTQDLRSFWQNTYPEVKKELKGRYPKHSWPDDPWTAEAIRGAKRRTNN